MTNPFSFNGQIGRMPYLLASLAVFFSQHLVVLLAFQAKNIPLRPDFYFWVFPLRRFVSHAISSDATLITAFAYGLLVAWILAALAFKRAASADVTGWFASVAVVPIIQIPVILALSVIPQRAAATQPSATSPAEYRAWAATVRGLVAGVALTLFGVAVSALVFRTYGYGLFVVTPFLIGGVTGFFANSVVERSAGETRILVTVACLLGSVALILAALEGAICVVLAAPLGIGLALVGGALGRAIAIHNKRPARQAMSAFAVLPLVFALESATSSTTTFDTRQSIVIEAPPERVWQSIIRMEAIEAPSALLFRLGLAYPVRGEVTGEGVGATRHGEFSTGTAVERVTEWETERKLAFVVVEDVPSIRELSPYEHVHAPHAVGYFTTSLTSFQLNPLPDGRTEVVERTSHQLKLEPVLYWLPMARFIVNENNARVLAHIKRQAERAAGAGG